MKNMFILTMFLYAVACSQSSGGSSQLRSVVAFGDSHIAGIIAQPDTYMDRMALLKGWTLDNQAVPGSEFSGADQYDRIMNYSFTANQFVLMMIGYNDVAMYGLDAGHLATFQTNLHTALNRLYGLGLRVYMLTTIQATTETYAQQNGSAAACTAYVNVIKSESAMFSNVQVVDTNALFTHTNADLIDTVHFNPTKHNQLALIVLHEIEK